MRVARHLLLAGCAALLMVAHSGAVSPLPSADGQFWDIQDTSPWAQDSGGIATGGRANPFNGFGYLKLQVGRTGATPSATNLYLNGLRPGARRRRAFDSITPVLRDGIVVVARDLRAEGHELSPLPRHVPNSGTEPRVVRVAWGGATGAFEDGGRVAVAATSSGDRAHRSVRSASSR